MNQLYRALIEHLGGCCAQGGTSRGELQIDHPDGRAIRNHDPNHRRKSKEERIRGLLLELLQGVKLRVLCKRCNSIDGRARQLEMTTGTRKHIYDLLQEAQRLL